MGARLALVAYELAAEKGLDHAPTRLLVRMALSALDEHERPWSQLKMVDLIQAMSATPGDAGTKVITRNRLKLVEAGLVKPDDDDEDSPRTGNRSGPARYNILFTADGEILRPVKRGTLNVHQSKKKGGPSAAERWTLSGGKVDPQRPPLREEVEEREEETAPPCKKHPDGWHHDEPCSACMKARQAANAAPTASGIITPPHNQHCSPGKHSLVADGTCMRCDKRAWLIAEESLAPVAS